MSLESTNQPIAAEARPIEQPPSSDERMFALAAWGSIFVGFPVVGPLVVYFVQKDKSPFVVGHAIQAAVLSVLSVAVTMLMMGGYLLSIVIGFAAQAAFGFGAFLPIVFMGLAAMAALLPGVGCLYGAWQAFQGKRWTVPLIGRRGDRLFRNAAK